MTNNDYGVCTNPSSCRAVRISEHVYWVGAIDWALRDFHGYATRRGSTYNAYLVMGEKITLIDTVKYSFAEEMLSRIACVVDPTDIDYIVSNHAEMDHSGALPMAIKTIQPEKVFASAMGVRALKDHKLVSDDIIAVKDGETISLGDLHLTFYETRMLHWPDSMFSYVQEDGVLFSNDAFGMHLASAERFDDEVDPTILDYEAAKYYANIILPYSHLVTRLLDKMETVGLEPKIIAPDHGPAWRKNGASVVAKYANWAKQRPSLKAVVVYDTMWESTVRMAREVGEGLLAGGAKPTLMPLSAFHRSDVAVELLEAGALVVGSPTLNNNLFPSIADLLTYLKGLKRLNMVGAAFGSYGWSGEAVGQINEILTGMKVELVSDGVRAKYVPDSDALEQCYALGQQIASALHSKMKEPSA